MRRPLAQFSGVLTVAVLATALVGCASPPSQTPSTPAHTRAHPSATPLFASDAEALTAATKTYAAYQKVADKIMADGGENPERVKAVETGTALSNDLKGFASVREKQWRSTGSSAFDSAVLQRYDPTGNKGVVTIYVCVNVSDVHLFDASGNSVVSPTRRDTIPIEAAFDVHPGQPSRLILSRNDAWRGESFCTKH